MASKARCVICHATKGLHGGVKWQACVCLAACSLGMHKGLSCSPFFFQTPVLSLPCNQVSVKQRFGLCCLGWSLQITYH